MLVYLEVAWPIIISLYFHLTNTYRWSSDSMLVPGDIRINMIQSLSSMGTIISYKLYPVKRQLCESLKGIPNPGLEHNLSERSISKLRAIGWLGVSWGKGRRVSQTDLFSRTVSWSGEYWMKMSSHKSSLWNKNGQNGEVGKIFGSSQSALIVGWYLVWI